MEFSDDQVRHAIVSCTIVPCADLRGETIDERLERSRERLRKVRDMKVGQRSLEVIRGRVLKLESDARLAFLMESTNDFVEPFTAPMTIESFIREAREGLSAVVLDKDAVTAEIVQRVHWCVVRELCGDREIGELSEETHSLIQKIVGDSLRP